MRPRLGWRFDLEDHDRLVDEASPFGVPDLLRAPEEILHEWLPVEDQGQLGSCRGFSGATACEVLNWIDTGGGVVALSAMFVYLIAQDEDGLTGDVGSTIGGGVRAMNRRGVCREETFPYTGQYTRQIPPDAAPEGQQHKLLRHVPIASYADGFAWLATGNGVLDLGILWTTELADNRSGVVENDRGAVLGGHAVVCIGYTRRKDSQGRNYLLIQNSHGEQYGRGGRIEVAPRVFDRWCRSPQCEVWGLTDLEEYTTAARPVDFRGFYTGR